MDPILFWNDIALEANRVSHTNGKGEETGPTHSARALAIVHLAMYDAFAGVSGNPAGLTHYLTPGPVAGASHDAAVAAAAHLTLSTLFPSQKLFFDSILAGVGNKADPGHNFGVTVAEAILDDREKDPGADAVGYKPTQLRGKHRPDPDNPDQGFYAPFYGAKCKLFACTERHELDDPPQPGDPDYTRALRQVRRRGIAPELMGTLPANSSRRTVDQTLIGVHWGYDGARELGTPPRLYNQIVRVVAENKNNSMEENARLFALVNVAMADAGILAWDQKYIHDLWRPVVGIREHDESMGPTGEGNNDIDNECQPDWLPLGAPATNFSNVSKPPIPSNKNFTPHFPAYPSGHATFGAAAFHITRLFYGPDPGGVNKGGVSAGDRKPDKLFDGLIFVSEEHNGINKDNMGTVRPRHVRNFPDGLWQMIIENSRSRVWLGVHWLFDGFTVKGNQIDFTENIGGVPLGLTIAEDIFKNGMKKSNK